MGEAVGSGFNADEIIAKGDIVFAEIWIIGGCAVVGDNVPRESDIDGSDDEIGFARHIDVTKFQRRGRIAAVEPRAKPSVDGRELDRGGIKVDVVDVVDDGGGVFDAGIGHDDGIPVGFNSVQLGDAPNFDRVTDDGGCLGLERGERDGQDGKDCFGENISIHGV